MPRACCTFLLCLLCAAVAQAGRIHPPKAPLLGADIEPQAVGAALEDFATQTGLQFSSAPGLKLDEPSKGARRGAKPERALAQILECTGLSYQFLTERMA